MTAPRTCSRCGIELAPADADRGRCPRCRAAGAPGLLPWIAPFAILAALVVLGRADLAGSRSGVAGPATRADRPANAPAPAADPTVLRVTDVAGLLAAIGSDRTVELAPGDYRISDLQGTPGPSIVWLPNYDGNSLTIRNVNRLRLVGKGDAPPRLLVEPRYVYVLQFEYCKDVMLENLVLGHEPEKGFCDSAVVGAEFCEGLTLRRCDLFGCGTYGLQLHGVPRFLFEDSVVRDCAYGILNVLACPGAAFVRSRFTNNEEYTGFSLERTGEVTFRDCTVEGNRIAESLFAVEGGTRVRFIGGTIRGNRAASLEATPGSVTLEGTTVAGNEWGD